MRKVSPYYDPSIGRFISEDPIQSGLNWYVYCDSNPITRKDPTGKAWLVDAALSQNIRDKIDTYTNNWNAAGPYSITIDDHGDIVNARDHWHSKANAARLEQLQPLLSGAIQQLKNEGILNQDMSLSRQICDGVNAAEFIYAYAGMLLNPNFGSIYDGSSTVEMNIYRYYSQVVCFISGTLIETLNGEIEIQNIEIGGYVFSRNIDTGEQGFKKVVDVFENTTNVLVHIDIDGTIVSSTPTHPFWVVNKEWTMALGLCIGDEVLLSNGETKVINNVEIEVSSTPIEVYNFEVEDWHKYFVSSENILVHNVCNVSSGSILSGMALQAGLNWLGEGYIELSSGVFRSSDNTRQFRMTDSDLIGHNGGPAHIHFESIGPDGCTIVENGHVSLEEELKKHILNKAYGGIILKKYVMLNESINGIVKLEIEENKDGVFLYLHRDPATILPDDEFSIYDEWYMCLEDAEEACEKIMESLKMTG